MSATTFDQLQLTRPILRALAELGHQNPTPIQAEAIPPLLAGRDLLGCAQTGTGKTGAFALPLLERLAAGRRRAAGRGTRSLILTPTRELAVQIADSLRAYGRFLPLRMAVVFGGVGQTPQVRACARGVDILVATPGRLLDLMGQGHIRLDGLEVFILDEADRMLDMGFLPDVKRIMATLPERRQNMLFSATMPAGIAGLADRILDDPVKVSVTPTATPVERIDQKVLFVAQANKRALLGVLLQDRAVERALVFTRTKRGAERLAKQLSRDVARATAIHGNKSQNARQAALDGFRKGRTRVLVATDVAARGIDVEGITHVFNYDLPHEPECYVHRIGRTARAGAEGVAISFCDREEWGCLRGIESLIRQAVPVEEDHPFRAQGPAPRPTAKRPVKTGGGGGGRRRSRSYRGRRAAA